MAIYHLSVKIIKRSQGRSAVESAAYRSAETLHSDYDGETYDYTNKNWVEHSEIILSTNAPSKYYDRESLWNAVEKSEKSSLARLCREVEVALPRELSREDQLKLVRDFVEKNFVSKGACVDFSIHNPPERNDKNQPIDINGVPTNDIAKMRFSNPHAHILTTLRTIDEAGKWEAKSEGVYLCKKNGEEKAFTTSEFKVAKTDGWEQQYQYIIDNKIVWSTPSEVENKDVKKKSRAPKSTLGRENEKMAYLNAKERIFEWRKDWENLVNEKYKERALEFRIDSSSFEAQGRTNEVPLQHMGVIATKMERRAKRLLLAGKPQEDIKYSDIGDINREIKRHNQFVQQLKEKLEHLYQNIKDTLKTLAQKMEIIRANMVGRIYQSSILTKQYNQFKNLLVMESDKIQKNHSNLSEKELQEYKKSLEKLEKLDTTITQAEKEIETFSTEYLLLKKDIISEDREKISSYQVELRESAEKTVKKQLKEHYRESFDEKQFGKAIFKADSHLNIKHKITYKNSMQNDDFPRGKKHGYK